MIYRILHQLQALCSQAFIVRSEVKNYGSGFTTSKCALVFMHPFHLLPHPELVPCLQQELLPGTAASGAAAALLLHLRCGMLGGEEEVLHSMQSSRSCAPCASVSGCVVGICIVLGRGPAAQCLQASSGAGWSLRLTSCSQQGVGCWKEHILGWLEAEELPRAAPCWSSPGTHPSEGTAGLCSENVVRGGPSSKKHSGACRAALLRSGRTTATRDNFSLWTKEL